MKNKFTLMMVSFILSAQLQAQTVIYVDSANISGIYDGTTWATAYTDLQAAIASASAGDSLWVAKGTYQPAAGTSFTMKEGVKIYGGFVSGATLFSSRSWEANATILAANGRRVIDNTFTSGTALTVAAVLDGFTVTGGVTDSTGAGINNVYASLTLSNLVIANNQTATGGVINGGGGIYNEQSSPVLTNVTISGNIADNGGGVYNTNNSSPEFTNVIISGNTASVSDGGGMTNINSDPVITNAYFYNNTAVQGGGMFNSDAGPVLTNVVFDNNNNTSLTLPSNSGGAMYNISPATPVLTNVTFYNNNGSNGGAIYSTGSTTIAVLANVVFWGNTAALGAADVFNQSSAAANVTYSYTQSAITGTGNILGILNPFYNPASNTGADGRFMTADDGLHLQPLSPAYNNGNNASIPVGITTDIKGSARIQSGTVEMGAYEGVGVVVLTVSLISFTGSLENNLAHLQWSTNPEYGFRRFEIEKSSNGQGFRAVGVVPSNSSGNYSFSMSQAEPRAYYRLRMTENNGRSFFSNIVPLSQPFTTAGLRVYPVPAKDNISVWVNEDGIMKIYDASGKVVQTQRAQKGINTIEIQNLYKGVYFCEVNDSRARFIKE